MLILCRSDIETLLTPGACLDAVEEAMIALHRGLISQPPRTVVPLHGGVDSALFMPGMLDRPPILGTKVVTIYPGNHTQGISSHHGCMLVFEADHGRPIALLEGSSITSIRTAAVSALATRLLARQNARSLALLGTGVQARSHLIALLEVREFDTVRVWSPSEDSRRAFIADVEPVAKGVEVLATSTAKEAVHGADVITTVTAAKEPILEVGWIEPGCHINAVGASTTTTRELDTATVSAATLFVDFGPAALAEAGELMIPVAEGQLQESHIRAELGAVAAGAHRGRSSAEEITVFKSVGLSIQDLAAAAMVIETAAAHGAGQVIDWV